MARQQAIQGQILIKTPLTSNGRDLIIGADGRIQYKETIVEAAARDHFEGINKTRTTSLKHIIEDIKPATAAPEPVKKTPVNYGVWGLKKLQGELEERGIAYNEDAEKTDLVTLLKADDDKK